MSDSVDLENSGLDPIFLKECIKTFRSSETQATVYVIGTAHVSSKSAEHVAQVIRLVKPDVIVVELCNSRAGILLNNQPPPSNQNEKVDTSLSLEEVKKAIKERGGLSGVLHVLLANMYKKIASQIKISPGIEFKTAYEEGKKLNSRIVLGDRPIEITLKRSWAMLSFWEKTRLIWHLMRDVSLDITEDDIEKLKNSDIITEMMEEFTQEFPSLAKTIIHERDLYLAGVLRKTPATKIVGVVGLGHLKGIEQVWNEPQLPSLKALSEIPNNSSFVWNFLKFSAVSSITFGLTYTLLKQVHKRLL